MQCPYCNHPLRDQAKFCNNCGATLTTSGAAAVAASAALPLAAAQGKAVPTGPLNRSSAAPTYESAQTAEPSASAAALLAPADEALAAPSVPSSSAPDALESEAIPPDTPSNQPEAGGWQHDVGQEEEIAAAGNPWYQYDLYAPEGDALAMNAPENNQAEEPLSPDDDVPTVRMPRPGRNEGDVTDENNVTADLLSTLGNQTPLQPGMLLEGRYHIEEVVHTSDEENMYRVTDQKGYLHCWACNTDFPETQQPERFCSNCGADMLGKEYWLRERVGAGQPEASIEAGSEADPLAENASAAPGINGVRPEGATDEAALLQASPQSYVDTESEELDWPTQPMTAIASFIVGPRHYRVESMEIDDPIFPLGVTLAAGARSDVGRTRRGNPNEDSILVMEFTRIHESSSQPFGLYIVADGLGGHDDGQTASRRAVAVMADYITREVLLPALQTGQYADSETLATKLKGAVEAANLALVGSNEQTGSDMGSTVTGAMIVGDTAHIVNVGDSRTYLYDGTALQPISIDHSLVMQLVIGGLIDREDIYTHPQRNQILRSLGDRRDVQIDLFTQKMRPGYQLVVCCDGLWEMIRDPQIEQVLREVSDPQAAADQLMELANQNGGEDNISVIVAQTRE